VPYYIYLVKPFAQLEKLAEFGAFSEASTRAKALRAEQQAQAPGKVKVIFAENELQAEDLLLQVRDPAPTGDE
jgi:hypothetical protein